MRAFITGITGFAGSHLAEHLLSSGDQVMGCSRYGTWPGATPSDMAASVELLPWNISQGVSSSITARLVDFRPACIYHLAAMSIPADCGQHEPNTIALSTNVAGTEAVMDLAMSLSPRPRVLLISSCYVYAPLEPGVFQVDENARLGPTSGYGKSKLAAEELFLRRLGHADLDPIVARVFQHTGPRQSPRMLVPQWSRQFVRGDDPVRVTSLNTHLDLTDVRDIVRAYRLLIQYGQRGEIYNVGSGRDSEGREIFEQLRRICDPQRSVVELSPGNRRQPIADIAKIATQTGWRPSISLETTLADTLDFWRSQQID